MKQYRSLILLAFSIITSLSSCKKDDDTTNPATYFAKVNFNGVNYTATDTSDLSASFSSSAIYAKNEVNAGRDFILQVYSNSLDVGTYSDVNFMFRKLPNYETYRDTYFDGSPIVGASLTFNITKSGSNPGDILEGNFSGQIARLDSLIPIGNGSYQPARLLPISGTFKIPVK